MTLDEYKEKSDKIEQALKDADELIKKVEETKKMLNNAKSLLIKQYVAESEEYGVK